MTGPASRPALTTRRLLGSGRGAAMLRPDATIDWWCPNRFDAEPLLWSLLDPTGAAASWTGAEVVQWDATPAGPTAHTTIRIEGRRVDLWDGLVAHDRTTVLIRLVKAEHGSLTVTHRLSAGGFDSPPQVFAQSPAPTSDRLQIRGGDSHRLTGTCVETDLVAVSDRWRGLAIVVDAHQAPPDPADLERMLLQAEDTERRASRHAGLPHHHPSRVIDALQVLHALTDPDSGASVASPTTSLPEAIGGSRQFDYRFSWLRDSGNALATAALLGHVNAAASYLDHVRQLLEKSDGHLKPVSTTDGQDVPDERQLDHVAGWAGSKPIRVGNSADDQRQMDSVTCILEAVQVYLSCGGRMTGQTRAMVEQMADMLVAAPFTPSNGVWELRDPQLLVSEELSRWVGLDRAICLSRRHRPWRRHSSWTAARDAARARVEGALDDATGLLPQVFGGDPSFTDASSLLVAINGFWPRRDPRLHRLVHATIARLEQGAFLRRYPPMDDGFTGVEATFVPASWWAVSALAAIGDLEGAERRADEMCLHLPPLQPEQWDVADDRALGNTPLLWSHTEAARALYNLHIARIRHRFGRVGVVAWKTGRWLRLRVSRWDRTDDQSAPAS